ncbi:hypothetical protein J4218_00345 [Candidatus Pacearchaeota archaeon]|nr:hypothetical protein [Candidatus Pacearchaeota archaeon]
MDKSYIPAFTHGKTNPVQDVSLLLQAYFREWNLEICRDHRMYYSAILQNTNYQIRKARIILNPRNLKGSYEERKKEVFISLFHEVLHIDPDFDPKKLLDIAQQMKVDLGNERCNKVFQFLVGRFASTWYIEEYLDECAEKVYDDKENNGAWIEELYKRFNLERIVNWKADTQQREFNFMNY